MSAKQIMAVGRITGGNIEIHVAPSIENRAVSAAKWYGALDAAKGETCNPGRYFSTDEMKRAYIEGYNS